MAHLILATLLATAACRTTPTPAPSAAIPTPQETPSAPEPAAPSAIPPQRPETITLAAVGDIQMGRGWPEEYAALPPDNAAPLFEHVKDTLQSTDVTFGNLETVLADEGESKKCKPTSKVCYAFRAPTAFAQTLKHTGFDVLSVANNHTRDFGDAGRLTTMETLQKNDLKYSGPTGVTASWEYQGIKLAMIAFGTGEGLFHVQDIPSAVTEVSKLAEAHDIVIVSFHGGAEGSKAFRVPKETEMFYGEDRGDVYAFAHAVIDAGADVVLGHGPHVLRGMELYKGRWIAYSLGNFSAWTGFNLKGKLGISAILHLTLATDGAAQDARIHPVQLQNEGVPHPDPEKKAIQWLQKHSSRDFGEALFDDSGRWKLPNQQNSKSVSMKHAF